MTREEEFDAYQKLLTMHPDAFVIDVHVDNEIHKYHCKKRDSFVAVCNQEGKFRRLIFNVRLH